MKVEFLYNNGTVRAMNERYAKVLQKLGKGAYLTRDMRPATIPVEIPAIEHDLQEDSKEIPLSDDLDAKTLEELRELAKARNIKFHPRTGAEKLRELLRDSE